MRFSQAICVLMLLALAGAARANKRPMFAEWLKQQKGTEAEGQGPASSEAKSASVGIAGADGSKTDAKVSEYYEEMDTIMVCLKEIGLRNCRCVDCAPATACCRTRYYESAITCCEHDDYYYNNYNHGGSFLPSLANHEIGSCDITSYFFDAPVDVATGVTKLGTFQMVCNIDNGGRCGEPFCDNMILTQNGAIYNASEVVSKTNPAPPAEDAACLDVAGLGANLHRTTARTMSNAFGTKFTTSRQPVATADVGAAYYGGESSTHVYYMSNAVIWTGPVTITSLHHDVQYYHGTMEYAFWDSAAAVEVTEAECNNRIMVNPYTYTLKLSKKHGNYY